MSMEWLKTAVLHEANIDGPGDGGGSGGDSISIGSDAGGDDPAPSSTPASEPAAAPSSTPAAKSEPEPIRFPNALSDIFTPRPSQPSHGAPSTSVPQTPGPPQPAGPAPAAGPLKPDRALLVTDPERYAEQQDAYWEWRLENLQSATKTPVDELRKELETERQNQWHAEFHRTAMSTKEALPRHWENILHKDPDFRSNPQLQGAVQDIIGFYVSEALRQGDMAGLRYAADPKFFRRSLLIAKDELGVGRGGSLTPGGGPTPVGPQGHASSGPRLVDDDIKSAIAEADREGYRYSEEQIAKALKRRNT